MSTYVLARDEALGEVWPLADDYSVCIREVMNLDWEVVGYVVERGDALYGPVMTFEQAERMWLGK